MWLQDRALQTVHSGFAADATGGVLFLGDSGAGKSTSAVACALDGLHFLSDDYTVIEERAEGVWFGHSPYCSIFFKPAHLDERFPELASKAERNGLPSEAKILLYLQGLAPKSPLAGAAIEALA